MNPLKIILTILVIVSSLQACSIRSSQLSALTEIFQKSSEDIQGFSWTISYGEYRAIVYAVSTPDGTLFSNQNGDSVSFDGWSVREVSGLGIRRAKWKIVDSKKNRQFFDRSRFVAEHFCDGWISADSASSIRYSQKCVGFVPIENNILVNDKGQITLIRQVIDGSNKYINLSKNH